jgi:uncharacterized membrane protein YidH (DUF202 family)
MRFAIAWILFGMPLAAVVFSWIGLCAHWNTEHHRFTRVSGILLPTAAALLACGALAYVQLVRPIASRDYRVEGWGLVLSFLGSILGFATLRFPRWFSSLALGASAWMFVLFFLAASTY